MFETLNLNNETRIKSYFLNAHKELPLVIEPVIAGTDLLTWSANHQDFIESQTLKYGGILFRNWNICGAAKLEALIQTISGEPLEYRERSSPRNKIAGKIYTSTEYPAEQAIAMHCENSYQKSWPMRIFFHCVIAATSGGETPIADTRKVFNLIAPEIREQFINKKVMYVRNFYDSFGLPWQTVFQTTDKAEVEEYCQENRINFEWGEENHLKTCVVRDAAPIHPQTGEMVWFNHAMFFHISMLNSELKEGLLMMFQPDELPANTYYGDGTIIEDSIIEHLQQCYQQQTVLVSWQEGDVLLLDNMLVAHGRQPYSGQREILVGMARLT